jgi:HD-GYP domain-containing protein (c-di-GMP phosphodiesterase class II)
MLGPSAGIRIHFTDVLGPSFAEGTSAMDDLRLAEPLAALSQVTDLGMGQPPETAVRTCLLATALARRMNVDERDIGDIYYTTLLQHVGCTAYAHETAVLFGSDDIALPARFAQVASQAVLFDRLGGPDVAIETVRRRATSVLDPAIAEAFTIHGRSLLAELAAADAAVAIIDAEPNPHYRVPDARLDKIARAFADTVDLKSPWTNGHSTGVARLAASAASMLGLPEAEVANIRRAALLHDLGRAGIPNGILDKPGPLTSTEWEQVWLHPYHSERILSCSPTLAPLAPLAGMHHERLDGSGYYRHYPAAMIPLSSRLVAVANMYQALTEERPYRPALSAQAAAQRLSAEASAGRLDPEAVDSVLRVAGHSGERTGRQWPAGLTEREVQVLRLAAGAFQIVRLGTSCSSRRRPPTITSSTSTPRSVSPPALAPPSSQWNTISSTRTPLANRVNTRCERDARLSLWSQPDGSNGSSSTSPEETGHAYRIFRTPGGISPYSSRRQRSIAAGNQNGPSPPAACGHWRR